MNKLVVRLVERWCNICDCYTLWFVYNDNTQECGDAAHKDNVKYLQREKAK